MIDYAIETHKLGRKFGNYNAVKDVTIQIKPGEVYGFLGPNGAGKSTTVKMLVGLLTPTSGYAKIHHMDVVKDAREVRLVTGTALQEAALDKLQTGAELLELQGRLYGLRKSEIEQRMKDMAQLVDIGPALNDRIGTYSGGMKRRVDLAAALIHNPKVLFLDEPTTGLDPISRAKVWEEVRALNSELGMTIFLTTQYLEEADELADRIGIINKGKIVAEDTPSNLKSKIGNDVIDVTVSDPKLLPIAKLKKLAGVKSIEVSKNKASIRVASASRVLSKMVILLNDSDIEILDLAVRQSSLDDVFLQVTGHKKGAKK